MANDDTDGVCSFREALQAVAQESDYNECTGAGTAPNTILFDQDGTYDSGDNTTPQFPDVANKLFVDGTGHVIELNGHDYHRFFRLSLDTSDLTVSNLKISHCGGEGGGSGGAVIVNTTLGSFTALNVNFSDNSAGDGGAISSSGDVTITNGQFANNHSTGNGGAIQKGGDSLILTNVLFTNNSADDSGGAIYSSGLSQFEATTITNCVFALNKANSSNSGHGGGAIYSNATDSPDLAPFLVDNSIFVSNEAPNALGGAIVNALSAHMEWIDPNLPFAGGITKSLFLLNKAGGSGNDGLGGAIYNQGEMTILDSTFYQNQSTNSAGGAVSHNNQNPGNMVIANSTFSANTAATNGGAIENHNDEDVQLINCTLTDNTAASGGALYNAQSSGSFNLSNSIVANSTAGGNCGPTGTYNDVANNIQFNPDTGCGTIPTGDPKLQGITPIPPQIPGPFLVPVHPLGNASAASSTGDAATCNNGPILSLDTQLAPRPQGGSTCDLGAFESNNAPGYGSSPGPGAVIDVFTTPNTPVSTTITVSETGEDNLSVSVSLAGDPRLTLTTPASFTIPDGGASQPITVQCLSATVADFSTSVIATHNAPNSPATYTVNCHVMLPGTPGYGSAPPPGTPLVINTTVGVPGTATVIVSETGTAPLTGTSAVGPQPEFAVTGGAVINIPDGGPPVNVVVQCLSNNPAGGTFNTTLSIDHNGANIPTPATYPVTCNVFPPNTPGYGSTPPPGTPLVINTMVGVPATATVTVSETGTATLTGTAAVGPQPEFSVTGGAVINIPDGGPPVDVVVQCLSSNPAGGTFTTTLTITHNGSNVPSPVLHAVTCNVTPLNAPGYGSVPGPGTPLAINTTAGAAATATVTVFETGTATLTGTSAVGPEVEFSVTGGAVINIPDGGAPVDVVVQCLSASPGTFTTTLTVTHNGANIPSPATYPVSCTVGQAGQAGYGSVPPPGTPLVIGTSVGAPATATVTVSETGTATLIGTSAVGPEVQFSVVGGAAFNIPDGGAPVDVVVQCLSGAPGIFTTTLSITHNGSNVPSPATHPVTCNVAGANSPGYGSIPPPPGPIGFGVSPLGGTVSTSFTILETGAADLTVSSAVISGPHAADFVLQTAFPITIVDGGPPQNVQMDCTPSGQGTRLATLTLTTNDPLQAAVGYDLICYGPPRELVMRSNEMEDLRPQPGGIPDDDVYVIQQQPFSSYEVVVDATSGDIGSSAPGFLERLAGDGVTVLQESVPMGVGFSRSLRFENNTAQPVTSELIRVRSTNCGANCGPDDVYRIRAYDTTYYISRFNNVAPQVTVIDVENASSHTVTGSFHFWDVTGVLLGSVPFSLPQHSVAILNTAVYPFANGHAGSVTISNDGAYGDLWGKTAQMTTPMGVAFDTYLEKIRN
jgi:predicted outer membrane repeat protein